MAIIDTWYDLRSKTEKVRLKAELASLKAARAEISISRKQERVKLHEELLDLYEKSSKQHVKLTEQNQELERIARNNPAEREMVLLLFHLSYACVDISGGKKRVLERRMEESLAATRAEFRDEVEGVGQDAEADTNADSQESN